jgi:hypothetical protein
VAASIGERKAVREAAKVFMEACGLVPTSDAIGQLSEAFLPCLQIMCERGYDPNGSTWRAEGWRGMLWKIRDKSDRLWFHGWRQGRFHPDHAPDMMNYLGFYTRLAHDGDPWGKRGAPGVDPDNATPAPKTSEGDME